MKDNHIIEHWKKLTEENFEKREVGEFICKFDDNYKLVKGNTPLMCKSEGGKPIIFFHNHPPKYVGVSFGEPKLSYGDIGWGIMNNIPCMCVGSDTEHGIKVKCFYQDLSEEEINKLHNELLTTKNVRDTIERKNPYKEITF